MAKSKLKKRFYIGRSDYGYEVAINPASFYKTTGFYGSILNLKICSDAARIILDCNMKLGEY